ncbi:unnamed protein product [Angiostrongylus costaricensis]|uniref:NADH-u_ox-rdase domain-containing protein n=1 Tax=Angiostrongylus costaricensis TaxID=334426 RepID=A0A158PK42_ANGCS|nr:unnamed protein product [Angiostrongylus costaricensis]
MPNEDDENPPLKSTGFWNPDPGFFVTSVSIATNFIISNMFLYGLTGRARLSYILSMMTIPCSVILCVRDARYDFERWKELASLRQKGIPDRFMPYKCKYDWTNYEKLMERKAND